MAGKKNIFDLYNEQNPKTENVIDEKIVERKPDAEQEKVVQKEEPKEVAKEEPKTEPTSEQKADVVQSKESEVTNDV